MTKTRDVKFFRVKFFRSTEPTLGKTRFANLNGFESSPGNCQKVILIIARILSRRVANTTKGSGGS